jgi:hypothetical protein
MRRKHTSRLDHIDKLLDELGARLRGLQLKKAKYGVSADPQIMNEISDIENEITELADEKSRLETNISAAIVATQGQIMRNEERQIGILFNLRIAEQLADMVKPLVALVAVLIALWISYVMTGLVIVGGVMALYATVIFCFLGRGSR